MENDKYILAIESAVAEGSIAIVRAGAGLVVQETAPGAAKAERIMAVISDLMRSAGIELCDLSSIAVSNGPGSYSGIRIGIATALGFSTALEIRVIGMSVLEAMASSIDAKGRGLVAVPVGKKDVAYQAFDTRSGSRVLTPAGGAVLGSMSDLADALKISECEFLFAHSDLLERLDAREVVSNVDLTGAGRTLAEFIGKAATLADLPYTEPSPIYLRNKNLVARPGAF